MKRLGVLVMTEPKNGGTFQYTLSMLESLGRLKGWNITLYTQANNLHYENLKFPIRFVRASPIFWPFLLLRFLLGFKSSDPFEKEDVVLAPIYSPLLLFTRKSFVFTLHDLQEHYFPQHFSLLQRIWRHTINKLLIKRSAHLLCESDLVRKDIIKFFNAKEDKISVITAPPVELVNKNYTIENRKRIIEKYNLPSQYFFYPAQFWPHKNHTRLVDAFALIAGTYPQVHLLFTGQKRYEFENIFDKVSKLGLDGRISHLGYVDQADLGLLFSCAFALVIPSLFESVSIPIYEAFQHSTAVCASNVLALPEQVGDAGLLFDPYSIESIANAMSILLTNTKLRINLGIKGKLRISEMTPEKYTIKLSNVLDSMYKDSIDKKVSFNPMMK